MKRFTLTVFFVQIKKKLLSDDDEDEQLVKTVLEKIEYVTFFSILLTFFTANVFPTRLNWMSFTLSLTIYILSSCYYIHFYAVFTSFRERQTSTMQFIGVLTIYTPLQSLCQKVSPCLTSDGTPFKLCLPCLFVDGKHDLSSFLKRFELLDDASFILTRNSWEWNGNVSTWILTSQTSPRFALRNVCIIKTKLFICYLSLYADWLAVDSFKAQWFTMIYHPLIYVQPRAEFNWI